MELVNSTPFTAGFTMATDKAGREHLVVVAKATYGIPEVPGAEPRLLPAQAPLVMGDVFTGEPATSALLYENDFAPVKPRCDVLLNGSAHAPAGVPVRELVVGLRLGALQKAFRVLGPRTWGNGVRADAPGEPRPFTMLPLSYDCAWGGVDRSAADPSQHEWYPFNPVGVGFAPHAGGAALRGQAMPCTEELDRPVREPGGRYRPMAFGPLGRSWRQRIRWAGTYDQHWLDQRFPFLPEDFDTRYFQSAPPDQQIDPPRGGEPVVLRHLTPQGHTAFCLPRRLDLPLVFHRRDQPPAEVAAHVDTVLLEPDARRFMLVWRASLPLRRNVREVPRVQVGVTRQHAQAMLAHAERMRIKRRFGSLAEAVASARRRNGRLPA